MPIPLVLIHGYSDKGESFQPWKDILARTNKYNENDIQICSYRSLTNEVTIKDIAEGFDRALRLNAHIDPNQPFDAIVHSTGMLVLRSWLSVYSRRQRIKRIIAIAPASFGSPLAHKGRSWLGAIFKGNRESGPDFMEAGDLVLDGLELGSRFTWDLAHRDLLNTDIFYGPHNDTPYVFTFCGDTQYKGLRGAITSAPGTDGTVRWAGCTLNTRKITLNFTLPPNDEKRYEITDWSADERTNLAMPLIPVRNLNHASIIENPSDELVEMALEALEVDDKDSYIEWVKNASGKTKETLNAMARWQQFVVRARDERGDSITDFNLQLYKHSNNNNSDEPDWQPVKIDVQAYSSDNSFRCFHINLDEILEENLKGLRLEFMASSGTELLGYFEYIADDFDLKKLEAQPTFTMDLSQLLHDRNFKFFYPFTTTLIEIVLNREPLPPRSINKVTWFLEKA